MFQKLKSWLKWFFYIEEPKTEEEIADWSIR